jgi:hypothetical protein
MTIKFSYILIAVIVAISLFFSGCTSQAPANNSSPTHQVTPVRTTYPSIPLETFFPQIPEPTPTTTATYYPLYVMINPVNRWYYSNETFELSGTTNLQPDDKLKIEVFEGIHPTPLGYQYTSAGLQKSVKIQPGTSGANTWSVSVNLSEYPPRCYWVWASTNYRMVRNETSLTVCDSSYNRTICEGSHGYCDRFGNVM